MFNTQVLQGTRALFGWKWGWAMKKETFVERSTIILPPQRLCEVYWLTSNSFCVVMLVLLIEFIQILTFFAETLKTGRGKRAKPAKIPASSERSVSHLNIYISKSSEHSFTFSTTKSRRWWTVKREFKLKKNLWIGKTFKSVSINLFSHCHELPLPRDFNFKSRKARAKKE